MIFLAKKENQKEGENVAAGSLTGVFKSVTKHAATSE